MNNHSTKIEIGQIGDISHISGQFAIGGDVVAGNKTVIQNIIQQAAKKIVSQPYKFLSSYEISDRDIFFGRDTLTEQLAGKVSRHRVLLINGASGSGKSSLINAGLIPRLAENGYTYLSFRDYHDPLRQLQDYLIKTELFPTARLQVDLLTQMVRAFQQQQLQVVFIFDQFERFFVNVPSGARSQFIEMIKVCMENLQPNEMNVIFSMREEFFGQFQREFEKIIRAFLNDCERVNIDPLSQEEARQAIIKPLTLIEARIGYDKTFVNEVLLAGLEAETGEQKGINPPHLQIVCNQLYQAAHQEYLQNHDLVVIDAKLYERLGGAQTILQTYLDDCVKTVAGHSLDHIKILRSLLKQMIETVGIRKFVTIQHLTNAVPEVPSEEVETLLKNLQDARVIEVHPEEQSYSLSHEVMVGKVASWFDEREMERKKAEETLEHGLIEWKDSGTLLNDKQVTKIRTWLADLNEKQQQLLSASEKFNRSQQRKNQLLRMSLVAFVLLAIGLGIVSYFKAVEAIKERDRADRQAQISLARQLAAQAEVVVGENDSLLQQGTLLAVESMRLSQQLGLYLPQADKVIRQGLNLLPQLVAQMTYNSKYSDVSFSHDGKRVAVAKNDAVQVIEVNTNKILLTIHYDNKETIQGIKFSPNAQHVVIIQTDKAKVYELSQGIEIGNVPLRDASELLFSPLGKYLAVMGTKKGQIWKLDNRQLTPLNYSEFTKIMFSSDDRLALIDDYTLIAIPTLEVAVDELPLKIHDVYSDFGGVICILNGHTVVITNIGGKMTFDLNLVDIATWKVEGFASFFTDYQQPGWEPPPPESNMRCDHGKYLIATGLRYIRVWNLLKNGAEVFSLETTPRDSIYKTAIDNSGEYLVSMHNNQKIVRVYDTSLKMEISRIIRDNYHEEVNTTVNVDFTFTDDSKSVAMLEHYNEEMIIQTYRLQNGEIIFEDRLREPNAQESEERDLGVRYGDDYGVEVKYEQYYYKDLFNSYHFSADGKYIAETLNDIPFWKVWEVSTGKILKFDTDEEEIKFINETGFTPFSPKLNDFMIVDGNKNIKVLTTMSNQQEVLRIEDVQNARFTPDGRYLFTRSKDQVQLRLWQPDDLIAQACKHLTRNLTQEEWQRFLPGEPYRKTCPQFPSGEILALVAEGEKLAQKAESKDIEAAIAKFNEAFTLDPLLKEHPFYSFNPEEKAKRIASLTLINKGESLAEERKLDEAIAAFKRAKELDASLAFDP